MPQNPWRGARLKWVVNVEFEHELVGADVHKCAYDANDARSPRVNDGAWGGDGHETCNDTVQARSEVKLACQSF